MSACSMGEQFTAEIWDCPTMPIATNTHHPKWKAARAPTSHSNQSLRTAVSVAGKRNFQGRDKEAETALEIQDAGAETKSP